MQLGAVSQSVATRLLSIFTPRRLEAFGYSLAAGYALLLLLLFAAGGWILRRNGVPVYTDFTDAWMAGVEALRGNTAALYDSAEFVKLQAALVGLHQYFYPNWPYPPPYFFFLAPFAVLPYAAAFVAWDLLALLACAAVAYRIVGRRTAIPLLLASPFTIWNVFAGQSGLLMASLFGAALLTLEHRPVMAGVFIGSLTCKPQFGILLPLALIASDRWRAISAAAATAAVLAGASIAVFGIGPWLAFPRQILAQTGEVLVAGGHASTTPDWGFIQTVYGLIRYLHGGAGAAWAAQGIATAGAAVIVWRIWRSPLRYSLKAATLATAALLATPYAFAYDMTMTAISVAFLASDQLDYGVMRGEPMVLIVLFAISLAILIALGSIPLGPVVVITLLGLILRRALYYRCQAAAIA
jgi:Glycosyltransferase family 87